MIIWVKTSAEAKQSVIQERNRLNSDPPPNIDMPSLSLMGRVVKCLCGSIWGNMRDFWGGVHCRSFLENMGNELNITMQDLGETEVL